MQGSIQSRVAKRAVPLAGQTGPTRFPAHARQSIGEKKITSRLLALFRHSFTWIPGSWLSMVNRKMVENTPTRTQRGLLEMRPFGGMWETRSLLRRLVVAGGIF